MRLRRPRSHRPYHTQITVSGPTLLRIDDLDVQSPKIGHVPRGHSQGIGLGYTRDQHVAHIDGVSSAPSIRPQLGGPLRPRPVQRQYAVAIRGENTCLHLRQSAAPVPMLEQPHTVLDLMYQDRRHPNVVPPGQEGQHPRVWNVPRQLRDYVRVQQVAGHSPSSST